MKKTLVTSLLFVLILALCLNMSSCGLTMLGLGSVLLDKMGVVDLPEIFGDDDTTVEEIPTVDPDGETTTATPDGETTTVDPDGETTTVDPDGTTTEDPAVNNEPQFDNVYHTVIDSINAKGPNGASTVYRGLGASVFELGRQDMVDAIADEVQVNKKGNLVILGWIAIFGGVNKYQYRVNDGEWMDAKGGSDGEPQPGVFERFGCFNSQKNAVFQEHPLMLDLNAYDGQTVTVELAAVPEIMPESRVTMLTIIDLTVDVPENTMVAGEIDIENHEQATAHPGFPGEIVFDLCTPGTAIDLGEIDLSKYAAVKIVYGSDPSAPLAENNHKLVLTSTGAVADGENLPIEHTALATSDVLTNATQLWIYGAREITVSIDSTYSGAVYLCHDMPSGHGIVVSQIIFVEK